MPSSTTSPDIDKLDLPADTVDVDTLVKEIEGGFDYTGIQPPPRVVRARNSLSDLAARAREADAYRIEADHAHDDYEDAEEVIRKIAGKRPNQRFDPWAVRLCQEFLNRPNRSRSTIAEFHADRDRLARRVAELEAALRVVRQIANSLRAIEMGWRESLPADVSGALRASIDRLDALAGDGGGA
jgi:hypothetical protein